MLSKIILVTILACCLLVSGVLGSWEGPVQVLQPLVTVTTEAILLSIVTYIPHWGNYAPSIAISRTCSENCIVTSFGPQNRNIANLMGLGVTMVYNREDHDGLFGDTLRVNLDTAGIRPDSSYFWVSPDTVVAATIECILGNAKRDSHVRYLDLRVIGDARYAPLGKVWDLEVAMRPPRRQFN